MANKTEFATLVVRDRSSSTIAKINRELAKLYSTARSLKNIKVDFKVTGNVAKASADIRKLNSELRQLQGTARAIRLNVNSSGIQQAARQLPALRAQAQRPITVATRAAAQAPPRQPPPPRGAGVFAGGGANVPGRFSVYVLGGIVGLTASSMAGIASAIGRATREGVKQVDIGDTSLYALQLDRIAKETVEFNKTAPKDRQIPPSDVTKTAVEEIEKIRKAQEKEPGGALMNRGLISQTLAETLPLAGYDVKQAGWLAERQIEFIKMEVQRGKGLAHAQETAIKYIKGLDLSGVLKHAKGVFDPANAERYINALKQIAPSLGKEFTGENVFQFLKYARQARYTATPETLMYGMLTSEEMGASSAGVALNQAVRQLLGLNVPTSTLAQLEKHGLVTTKPAEVSVTGKKKTTKKVVDQPLDEEMLRANFWQFVREKLIPRMQAEGLDPTKSSDAAKLAAQITSTATARDLVTGAITRMADLMQEVERAKMRDPKLSIDPDSMLIAAEGLGSQVKGVLGEAVRVIEPLLIPKMQTVGNYLSDLTRDMRAATEGDKKAQERVEGTATKLVAAVGGTALLLKSPIGQAIAAAAAPAGIAAGVAGVMTPGASQTAQSLAYAGISLNTAGQQLQTAAATQIGMWGFIRGALRAAGIVALGGIHLSGTESDDAIVAEKGGFTSAEIKALAGATPEQTEQINQRAKLRYQLSQATKELTKQEELLNSARKVSEAFPGRTGPLGDIKAAEERVKAQQEQIKLLQEQKKLIEDTLAGVTFDPATFSWENFWKQVQRDVQKPIEVSVVPVVPPAAVATFGESLKGGFSKAAERAQRQEQRKLEREQRTRFPKGVPLPKPRLTEAQREELEYLRSLKGEPDKGAKPPLIKEPEKKVEAPAKTFAEALDKLRTTEPAWLSTYTTATKETPAWMTTFKEASAETGTAGTKFASAATTLNDAATTNANSALKIIEANATYVSTATQYATSQATAAASMQTSIAQLVAAPSAFATVFSAGASEIGNSGSVAASIIVNAMPGAGAMLGNAAAAAIQAAVSDINITAHVKTESDRPDTGGMSGPK